MQNAGSWFPAQFKSNQKLLEFFLRKFSFIQQVNAFFVNLNVSAGNCDGGGLIEFGGIW